jgi:hypothetical protein
MRRAYFASLVFTAACSSSPQSQPPTNPIEPTEPAVVVSAIPAPTVSGQALDPGRFVHVGAARPAAAMPGGYVRDFSWSRIGGAPARGTRLDEAAYAVHPRLGGAPFVPPSFDKAPQPRSAPVDWSFSFTQNTNVSPALYAASLTTPNNSNDRLYVYGGDATNARYIGALSSIYTTPALLWKVPVDSAVNGSSIAVSLDGQSVYAITGGIGTGTTTPAALWQISNVDQSFWQVTWGTATSQWTSPWVDYSNSLVYAADEQDHIVQVDFTGAMPSGYVYTMGFSRALHATPVVNGGQMVFANDGGDVGIYTATFGTLSGVYYCLSPNGNCTGTPLRSTQASDAFWSTAYIDATNDRLLIANNRTIWQIPSLSTIPGCSATNSCPTATGVSIPGSVVGNNSATFRSSVLIDPNSGTSVYYARNGRLGTCSYTAASGLSACGGGPSVLTLNAGADSSYPRSSPVQYEGNTDLFIGDGGGFMNRITTSGTFAVASSFRFNSGGVQTSSVNSTAVIDFAAPFSPGVSGSIYYGAATTSGTNPGVYIQLSQSF